MRTTILVSAFMTSALCLAGQVPATSGSIATSDGKSGAAAGVEAAIAEPPVFKSEGDFTFSYPADWEVVDMKPMLPVQRLKAEQNAKSEMEKRGASCADVQLTIRHGDPASVILIMFLEFKCLGLELKEGDLGSTGLGIATGLTKSFSVKNPKYGAYNLGKHAFWIERADGTPLNHPEHEYKLETTCTLLKKGLVCWLAMAGSSDAIPAFETSNVSLEGDSPLALVPASAFEISN
jgi:hypothetical protein